ncbi:MULTISPECIES: hypothetical protein [Kribbella]|uniref:Ig-like domain-containing protein n=1 Tax=Kribbella karoonensis TaxID=324851 RepID=A0ABN2DDP0_9ACTN
MKRALAALLGAPLALAVLPAVAQADPDPRLHVESVTLNRGSVAVSGLNTVPVTVTVKGSYTVNTAAPVNVILERTGGSGGMSALFSTNLSRDAATGTWSGALKVPSTANGTFKVSGVQVGPFSPTSPPTFDPTPYAGPSLAVIGTHQPRITAAVTPKVVPFGAPYSIRWAVTDAQTGKPYGSRIRVALKHDSGCVEYFGPGTTDVTDTNGIVTKTYPGSTYSPSNCLIVPGDPWVNASLAFTAARPAVVSATPSRTSAPVGTIVAVNGAVAGAPFNCWVQLQRLYGASQWRTVNVRRVRQSGRFTLEAQPAYRGTIPYRVSFPACAPYVAGLGKTFSIRGT